MSGSRVKVMSREPQLLEVPGPSGAIPALLVGEPATARASVLLRYGLGGTMAVQLPEALRLAAAGLAVLIPEAPHHGLRGDGHLERQAHSPDLARSGFLDLVEASASETGCLLDHLAADGAGRFVVAGVSMGGFAALAGPADPRVGAVVALLADPCWDARPSSPHLHLARWRGVDLFAAVAENDEVVPPAALRTFTQDLAARFTTGERHLCRVLPGGHTLAPQVWAQVWEEIVAWLSRLGA